MKTSLKVSLVAAAIAALPLGSHAAGLGAINVFSGLGQPLRAEIELQATPDELESLTARVPSADIFRQSNVGYSPLMLGLQLSVERRGNRSVVRVSSDRPINEPFLDMLVELNWSSGRLLREYTFLLDPVTASPPAPAAARVEAPAAGPAATSRSPRPAAAPSPRVSRYEVQRGDTLRGIASANRPEGTSVDQVLIALLRQNPEAFDDGNINRLRAGAILSIPDRDAVQSVDGAQARREIVAQAADFDAYRQRLAGAAAARTEAPTREPTREAGGAIEPRVEEAPRTEATDRVEVSGAPGDASEAGRTARLQALEEELVAREKSLEEANSRLADLENSIRDLQRLIEMRNQTLAQLQQQLEGGGEPLPSADELLGPAAEEPAADAPGQPEAVAPEVEQPAAESPAQAVPPPPVAAPEPTPEPAERPRTPVQPQPDPFVQPSMMQSLLQDPALLAGGGAVLALLLGYAGIRMRQRRKAQEALDSMSGLTEYPSEGQSVFGAQGGQSVDTGSSSVLHSDFSQSGLSAIDADEGVDPVAEADVYMAYGRDAQAEEILLDALKADGSRAAIYLKLLEIYAHRGNLGQFEAVATDLYSRTGGASDEWQKAAAMGRKLDPDNPLYQDRGGVFDTTEPTTEQGMTSAAGTTAAAAAAGVAAAMGSDRAVSEDLPEVPDVGELPDQVPDEVPADEAVNELEFPQEGFPTAASQKDTWTVPGEFGRLAEGAESVEPPADAGADDIDFSVLDFDLGNETAASAPASEQGEMPQTNLERTAGVDNELTFDLDMDSSESDGNAVEAGPEDEKVSESDAPGEDLLVEDGDSFEPASADAAALDAESMKATVIGNELDLALSGGDEYDEDATADESPGTRDMNATVIHQGGFSGEDDSSVMDLEQTGFDNSLLNFDFDLSSPMDADDAKAPALDLTSIDLDLELPDEAQSAEQDAVIPDDGGAAAAGEAPEFAQEVETKLDLARAYEEMGDKEGARELLEEVLRDGTAKQQEAASKLIERLG